VDIRGILFGIVSNAGQRWGHAWMFRRRQQLLPKYQQ